MIINLIQIYYLAQYFLSVKLLFLSTLYVFNRQKMRYIYSFILYLISFISFSQVGINTNTPDPSSALDVTSTSQGFLPPRMTEAQRNAIVSPARGLFIYNLTSNCFQFYNGGAWSKCIGEVESNKLDCNSIAVNGYYLVGQPLIATNTITIDVLVNVMDSYTISTNTVNGYSFSASGVFTSIGINTITLVGMGTPIAAQSDNFTINFVGTGFTCNKTIVVNGLTRNCLDYKNAGYNTDGLYIIDPDGVGGNAPFNCYCDMTHNGGGWTLVFNHNIAGGYWTGDAEADQFNIASPGLTTNKYSILYKIDAIKSSTAYEFRLYYPTLNKTNHWKQTFNPRSGGSPTSPVAGYVPISIDMTGSYWGGLENNNVATYLDGSVNHGNWWYSIGSTASYGTGGVPADVVPTDKVQLFIR